MHDGVTIPVDGLEESAVLIRGRSDRGPKSAMGVEGDVAVANHLAIGDLVSGKTFFLFGREVLSDGQWYRNARGTCHADVRLAGIPSGNACCRDSSVVLSLFVVAGVISIGPKIAVFTIIFEVGQCRQRKKSCCSRMLGSRECPLRPPEAF